MSLLASLAESDFSAWLSISMLGFPTLIAVHSVGMAIVVGLSLIVSLYLCRVITGFDQALIPRLLSLALWGFGVNLITGLLLFMTRGPEYLGSYMFLLKMLLVAVSATILVWLRYRFRRSAAGDAVLSSDRAARVLSLTSTGAFLGAVIAGRLIAYLSDLYR